MCIYEYLAYNSITKATQIAILKDSKQYMSPVYPVFFNEETVTLFGKQDWVKEVSGSNYYLMSTPF